jgi:hypothetical protein
MPWHQQSVVQIGSTSSREFTLQRALGTRRQSMAEGNSGATSADVVHVLDSFLKDMSDLDSMPCEVGAASRYHTDTHGEPHGAESRAVEPTEKRQRVAAVQARLTARQPTKKHIPSWQRRKQELDALRQQTEALETRVAFLQLKRPEELVKWKAKSIKEQRRRQTSESENAAMKRQLRGCTRVANALQRTIATVVLQGSGLTSVSAIDAALSTPRPLPSSSSDMFKDLDATRLDTRSHDMHAALDEAQRASAVVDSVEVNMYRADGSRGETMEYLCARTLPFDEAVASNAVWSSVRGGRMPQKQVCEIVKRSEDSFAARSLFVHRLARGEVLTADIHCVIRRVAVPAGGCVVLAESTTHWAAHHEQTHLWDHASREAICFVCRRCSLGRSSDAGCQISLTLRSESTDHQMLKNSPIPPPSVHAVAMASCSEMIESHRQLLENRMWDSARSEPRSGAAK